MSTRKVVWVLDHQGEAYHDAQPLLCVRNINFFIFDRNKPGNLDLTNYPLLAKLYGQPDLMIIGKEHEDLLATMQTQFMSAPEIWRENTNASDLADQPNLPFKDATTLITWLTAHFFPVLPLVDPVILLDREKSSIAFNGQSIKLTPREFDIVTYLYNAPGHSVSRKDFFTQVWKGLKICNKVLDVHVSNLRKKVHQHGINIQFVKPSTFELSFAAPPSEVSH